jgi:hypothetical protein
MQRPGGQSAPSAPSKAISRIHALASEMPVFHKTHSGVRYPHPLQSESQACSRPQHTASGRYNRSNLNGGMEPDG